jgi:hypothetical protein
VYFINEQNTRYNIGFTFFSPFCYLCIDLISNFGFNFSSIAREKS